MTDKPSDPFQRNEAIPCLRSDLDFIPVTYQGRRALVIKDPLGLMRDPVLLSGDGLLILELVDGRRSAVDIHAELVRMREGRPVGLGSISGLAAELESAFILDSARFRAEKNRLVTDYAALRVRPPCMAGRSYPADPRELGVMLDEILDLAGDDSSRPPAHEITGLAAPHIDLEIGRRVYARTFAPVRALRPKAVLLLGTGHALTEAPLCLTDKDFETPLGLVKTDKDLVKKLRFLGGAAVEPFDFGHKEEHSLELELLFLQRLFGSDFRLVPLLCGSLSAKLHCVRRARELPAVARVLEALAEWRNRLGSDALVVAGVDLSHIGPKFGHDLEASQMLPEAKRHDRALLDALGRMDAGAFWEETARVDDRFNVCGFSSLAFLLEILPRGRGWLLDYDTWNEEPTRSAVSFAGLAFTKT
jgi:AmmeMemoRadiSam system protein B